MKVPWTIVICAFIGGILIILPESFHIPKSSNMQQINHLCGALILGISLISFIPSARSLFSINFLGGVALTILSALWLSLGTFFILKSLDLSSGLMVIILTLIGSGEQKKQAKKRTRKLQKSK